MININNKYDNAQIVGEAGEGFFIMLLGDGSEVVDKRTHDIEYEMRLLGSSTKFIAKIEIKTARVMKGTSSQLNFHLKSHQVKGSTHHGLVVLNQAGQLLLAYLIPSTELPVHFGKGQKTTSLCISMNQLQKIEKYLVYRNHWM